MDIVGVAENGTDIAGYTYLPEEGVLIIPRKFEKDDNFKLTVYNHIDGDPKEMGVHWVEGVDKKDENRGNGSGIAAFYTQMEAMNGRKLFPCQDTAQTEASFTTRLTYTPFYAPDQATPINGFASGELLDTDTLIEAGKPQRERKIYVTKFEIPMYLYAIMVGPLVSTDLSDTNYPIEIVSRPEIHERSIEFAQLAVDILDYYEDEFDRGFTLPVLRLGMIPHYGYPYGAMENMGFIFFKESYLYADGEGPLVNSGRAQYVMAHEGCTTGLVIYSAPTPGAVFLLTKGLPTTCTCAGLNMHHSLMRTTLSWEFMRSWQTMRRAMASNSRINERQYWGHMNVEPRRVDILGNPAFGDPYSKGTWVYRELENQIGKEGMRYVLRSLIENIEVGDRETFENEGLLAEIGLLANVYADGVGLPFGTVREGLIYDLVLESGMPMLDVTCEKGRDGLTVKVKQDVFNAVANTRAGKTDFHRTYDLGPIDYRLYPSG